MRKSTFIAALAVLALSWLQPGRAQVLSEDFTQSSTGAGDWVYYYGACLTAGTTNATTANPTPTPTTSIPPCTGPVVSGTWPQGGALTSYYGNVTLPSGGWGSVSGEGTITLATGRTPSSIQGGYNVHVPDPYLAGGVNGYLGCTAVPTSSSQANCADPPGSGALRFTNAGTYTTGGTTYSIGNGERGGIVTANTYPASTGLQVTFKTITYGGDNSGSSYTSNSNSNSAGSDGISFFILDGCMPLTAPAVGTAPSAPPSGCASNTVYTGNGYTGTFPGVGAVGGSFGYSCSNENTPPDGVAGGYLAVGIDEYGNFLNGFSNTLGTSYSTRTPYSQYVNNSVGDNTFSGGGFKGSRIGIRGAGNVNWQALTNAYGANPGSSSTPFYPSALYNLCYNSTATPTYTNGLPNCTTWAQFAVEATCATGTLYNFATAASGTPTSGVVNNTNAPKPTPSVPGGGTGGGYPWNTTPSAPSSSTAANLANSNNSAKIMDYPAIASAILSQPLADEAHTTRTAAAAAVIYYNLTITQAGRLSLSYATSGSTSYTPVISNYNITTNNGALPSYVRFGFAGSTGGGTNIHEVLCFQAAPETSAASSAGINQKQSTQVEPNSSFAYFAYYNPAPQNWSGRLTANALSTDSSGNLVVAQVPTWDASCVLSGAPATGTNACSTGVATTAQPWQNSSTNGRVILSCYGAQSAGTACAGVPFESSSGGLNSNQLANLGVGDSAASTTEGYRVSYLRGDRSNEIRSSGGCTGGLSPTTSGATAADADPCFRRRVGVLGDIVDSSPVWVGPPQFAYTQSWQDSVYGSFTAAENAGQTYLQFQTLEATRPNIVYAGANDGMLHGFRSGSYLANGSQLNTGTGATPNDGLEVLAYIPGAALLTNSANVAGTTGTVTSSTNPGNITATPLTTSTSITTCTASGPPANFTPSLAQNIHGVWPAVGSGSACTGSSLDFSNTSYNHNFFVDATPGQGDLFYQGAWHSWLVGGLGPGGAALYALDVTNPTATDQSTTVNSATTTYYGFTEGATDVAGLVIGEWNPATITCAHVNTNASTTAANCGQNLGNTYGSPVIRRLHDGNWGVIFGNGFGSLSGDAGIFVMVVNSSTGGRTFYYLSTGTAGTNNGIAYVTNADLDGDRITDYVYAGDLKGNVWRFDLTGSTCSSTTGRCTVATNAAGVESAWISTAPFKLFTTPSGQPITTKVLLAVGSTTAGGSGSASGNTLLVTFGTGRKTQVTNSSAVSYQSGQQSLYGVWDWNMTGWNSLGGSAFQYASMPFGTDGALAQSNLEAQTETQNATEYGATQGGVSGTNNAVCWAGSSACSGTSGQYGWYLNLPGAKTSTGTPATTTYEQIIYNPELVNGYVLVNSVIPANNNILSCTVDSDTGYTYAVHAMNGGTDVVPGSTTTSQTSNYFFQNWTDSTASAGMLAGVQLNATGTDVQVATANGNQYLVYQTIGQGASNMTTSGSGSTSTPPDCNSSNATNCLRNGGQQNYVAHRLSWVQLR